MKTDISNEFNICRYRRGIKLVAPHKNDVSAESSIKEILQLPMNIYFLAHDSTILKANENCVISSRVDSLKDLLGKTVLDICPINNAKQIMATDASVVHTKNAKIAEEDMALIKHAEVKNHCLSFKLPWYDAQDSVLGIFGYSIYFGRDPFDNGLAKISQLGLLNVFGDSFNAQLSIEDILQDRIYFSKREKECIYFIMRGKSAKEIAKFLDLSHRTVEFYIENIKHKMKVDSKSELIDKLMSKFIYCDIKNM